MKLSKLFHTLYATVMALPVLIIPIFALNILHKETEPISIEIQEKVSVDFNQLMVNDEFSSEYPGPYNYITASYPFTCVENNVYIIKLMNGNITNIRVRNYTPPVNYVSSETNDGILKFSVPSNSDYYFIQTRVDEGSYSAQYNLFNLTQMGLEDITTEQFNSMFTDSYYPYTESQKMLVNKPSPTTYNSTDIGSQFVYALYKPVSDYFNFGEFFGLGGMYDWFQLNIFNGTAPLSFFIVFNVMIYWLFISLFWLLFDILIYVPMVIHKWLDKAEM